MLKNRLIIFVVVIFCTLNSMAKAAEMLQNGFVDKVSQNLEFYIVNSSEKFELAHLYIPPSIYKDTATEANEFSKGKEFDFQYIGELKNRHGNFSAVIKELHTNISIQQHLLESGLAITYFMDESSNEKQFFNAEALARKSKLGIWKNTDFIVHDSNKIVNNYLKYLNNFIIVTGVVDNIYQSKKNTYINFGKDWKTDFTVQFENKMLKKFLGFNPVSLKGKRIMVRGWLEDYNGPFMKIFNPANVEIIKESK